MKRLAARKECKCCGRVKAVVQGGNCGWCVSKLKSGLTVDQVQELFLTNEPIRGGKKGPRNKSPNTALTLTDVAKLSAQLEDQEANSPAVCAKAPAPPATQTPVKTAICAPCTVKDQYPICKMVPCWFCSDGEEYGNEVDALRHEVELLQAAGFKRRVNR